MKKIITLTANPAIDKNSTVANLVPDNKLRCSMPNFEAGGGGINVSRAIKELGGESLCLFFGGGNFTQKSSHRRLDSRELFRCG